MTLLAGALDHQTRLEELEAMAASVDPPARLEVFPGAAHALCHPSDPTRWWTIVDRTLAEARGTRW